MQDALLTRCGHARDAPRPIRAAVIGTAVEDTVQIDKVSVGAGAVGNALEVVDLFVCD